MAYNLAIQRFIFLTMTGNEVRTKFLKFFESKKHRIIESDSVVPKDDPTVLFTTAGMQQFKKQFLGYTEDYTRAASSQKCIRTDDLEEVGKTPYHHTFFEMLGNFSFGDYFKKEAIAWGWEFLTKELGLKKDKLWVSVYKDDDEAYNIWLKEVKIPKERILKLGDKDNFWPANAKQNGPNGPCGPCSEIFYDWSGTGKDTPETNPDRFSEVWNLVFTQFNRKEGGELEPLPNKNIDTGMGLERLTAVMQGKKSNFETDLFAPILKAINKEVPKADQTQKYIIADHLRAITFGINDGVVPSNEGRGYVIKKLIVTASDIAIQSGQNNPVIHKLIPAVVESMKEPYPELVKSAKNINETVKNIEESFIKTRKTRLPEFEAKIKEIRGSGMVYEESKVKKGYGDQLFLYRDTYGLTLDTLLLSIKKIIGEQEYNATIPKELEKYKKQMNEQQERSRASSNISDDVFANADLNLNVKKTEFVGYDHHECKAKVLKIFNGSEEVKEAKKGDNVKVVLDSTPFYAEAGGQIGDEGALEGKGSRVEISDTHKINDIFLHIGSVANGSLKINDTVEASINQERRLATMRNHTATHILQAALREVLGTHVKQQGSLVAPDRLRFDFTHPKAITRDEIVQIESIVNGYILDCDPVTKEVLPIAEAKKKGALAFFAEKYGDTVRVVSIGDYSKEFCGGTHLSFAGQIGSFKITAEGAIAQGIRRLEAVTGTAVPLFYSSRIAGLESEISLKAKKIKTIEKELEKYRFDVIKKNIDELIKNAVSIKKVTVVSHLFDNLEINLLRKISDLLKQKVKSSVIVLGSKSPDNALILAVVSDDLIKKGIKADEIIKDLAPLIEGSGGGNPKLAQAGSKSVDKISTAIKQVNQLIKARI